MCREAHSSLSSLYVFLGRGGREATAARQPPTHPPATLTTTQSSNKIYIISSSTMSTYSMLVLLAVVATASAQIQLTNCARNIDCRTYGDASANCVSNACDCTAPDTTEFCSANSTGTTGVSYVFSFTFDCDRFFTSPSLISTIRLTIEQTVSLGEIAIDITFSCGSVQTVVNAEVPVGNVASIGAEITANLETALVDTEMNNTLSASAVSVDAGATADSCSVTSPAATSVYVPSTNMCTVTSCTSGYELQTTAPTYVAQCVEVVVESDDDLSDGAIAAIVMGGVALCALIAAAMYIVFAKKPEPEQKVTNNEPMGDVDV